MSARPRSAAPLRVGSRLGKYKLTRRLGDGGFARVYAAFDTLEHRHVALKVPRIDDEDALEDALREIRIVGKLDHPNILGLKNADYIDDRLVLVFPLGTKSLDDRLRYRIGIHRALDYAEQLLEALAHAHERRVLHRDLKPANVILFDDELLRLGDFGAASPSSRTKLGTTVGTVGYMAPEQGMGKTSPRADVFAAGLVLYRMTTGKMFAWPFDWPGPGRERLRRLGRDWTQFLQGALAVNERKRYPDGGRMLQRFMKARPAVERHAKRRRR